MRPIRPSQSLADVRYEIRGPLAQRALELEREGHEIIKLNIGNPGIFGFRAPEAMQRAIIDHLETADAYTHQKGIMPAREAIVRQQAARGVQVSTDEVFIGNGVSELILSALRGLLDPGDEVLVPSPDYPLWTAAVTLNGGKAVHYPCHEVDGWIPDVAAVRAKITPRTRALVVISPNNPTGAVYPRATMEGLARLAEEHGLVVYSDEIYDQILYDGAVHVPMATLVKGTLCITFGGLSKVYRACGYRVGWLIASGDRSQAGDYLRQLDVLSALRLCSNVPGQWAVPAAIDGHQSIHELTAPGGRLYETRRAVIDGAARSQRISVVAPQGALYAFLKIDGGPGFDDAAFALKLLEQRHVLLTPGRGFNVPYRDHLRITLLPQAEEMREVFHRLDAVLAG